jgi:hypothetical protein
MPSLLRLACTCLLAGAFGTAWAQSGIYTCVDAKGRRFTSDRPISECLDREQKELNPNGTVRRVRPPVPTEVELAAQEQKDRQLAEDRQREAEHKRMDKLLLARYPTPAAFESERAKTLRAMQNNPEETRRATDRFAAEQQRLRPLWAPSTTASAETASVKR